MSTRYNTGNPIESTDVRDMSDNAKNLDLFSNSSELSFDDRLGIERKTIHGMNSEFDGMIVGMNSEFDAKILNMGFTRVGTFATGGTLTNPRQTLLWDIADGGDGQEYGWSGSFTKVVPASSTPLTTGGIAVGAWMSRFDPELRIQVHEALRRSYAEAGYNLVDGSFESGGTVTTATNVLLYEAEGKAYSWGGTLPKTVPVGSTPESSGGIGSNAWLPKDTAYLRQDLHIGFSGIYRRQTVVSEIASGIFPVGARLTLTDRGGADFDVVAGGTANGFNILNAGNGNTAQLVIYNGDINTKHWGMIADYVDQANPGTDNAAAFAALMDYINVKKPLSSFRVLIHGDMSTSDTLTVNGGGVYAGRAIVITASGSEAKLVKIGSTTTAPLHAVVYLKKPSTAGAFACANVTVTNLLLVSATSDYGIASNDQVTMFSDDGDLDMQLGKAGAIGYFFTDYLYINRFGGGQLSCAGMAFKNTRSGTTNSIGNLFAYGCQLGAYEFRMTYSNIGSLAADNCVGIIYNFVNSQISVGSLGCESPGATVIVRSGNGATIDIGQVFLQSLSPTTSTFTVAVVSGGSGLTIDSVYGYIPTETATVMTGGKLIDCPSSSNFVEIGRVHGYFVYGIEDTVSQNSSVTVGDRSGEKVNRREKGMATLGGGRSSNPQWYNNGVSKPAKTIFLNHGGSANTLVDGTDVRFDGQGLKAGDIVIFNNAGTSGIAAQIIATPGVDFSSSSYKNIPVEEAVADVASLPSSSLRAGRRVSVISIKKTLTYYTSPAGWYDETGTKIA